MADPNLLRDGEIEAGEQIRERVLQRQRDR
jgi:hypothetical protein